MKTLRQTSSLVTAMLVLLAANLVQGEERRAEGRVQSISGTVTLQSQGESASRPAVADAPVYAQDRVVTGAESRAEIVLNDGSLITLQPDSRIEIVDSRANVYHASVLLLIFGWLEAEAAPEVGSRLEVQTATAVAGIRGTHFMVAGAADCASRVIVERGKVEVWGHTQTTSVTPGRQVTVNLLQHPLDNWATQAGGEAAAFVAERSQQLAESAGPVVRAMDREMEARSRRAEAAQKAVARQFAEVETAARRVDAAAGDPSARAALHRELEVGYARLRYLQYQDGYLVSCDEMMKQLLQDAEANPGNYAQAGRKRVLAFKSRILGRDVASLHGNNLRVLDDYAGKLDALVDQYQLADELGLRR